MNKFYQRQEKKEQGPQRKNDKPEKKLVEAPCKKLMKSWGWSYQIIEAKAVWSKKRQRFVNSHVKKGTVDCSATDNYGFSCWIEFKAPGRRADVNKNEQQLNFVRQKIMQNAFSVVVDSAELLEEYYSEWIRLRWDGDLAGARQYLLDALPKKRRDE